MLRVFTYNPENALSFDNLALITSLFYRRLYLHILLLLDPVNNSASCQIVW